MLVFNIGIIVISTLLPSRIRWIAHDHSNIQLLLSLTPCAVLHQQRIYLVFFLIKLEGVGEADTLERLVFAPDDAVVLRLYIDGGDVVSQQHDLVGVDFVLVFVRQLLRRNQTALQQAGDECSRAGERVEDMHALTTQRLAELGLQDMVDAVDDEIYHFHRRIDDAEFVTYTRES